MSSRLPGFFRLPLAERRRRLADAAQLDAEALAALDGGLDEHDADHMIENVIGRLALPLAVATNFTIDGVDALVPMAAEEPSVVAAASNGARMIRAGGGFTSTVSPAVVTGQIQIVEVGDVDRAVAALTAAAPVLLERARALAPRLVARGGGPRAVSARILARPPGPDGGVVVLHLDVDCLDAMGANLVNTLCEQLADDVAARAGGEVGLRILSNLSDQRTVRITGRIPDAALGDEHTDGGEVRAAIARASRFAEQDPYRAVTHNKGIMNGVDAVLVATGQDWRAVEAGAHAFAARTGAYRPLAIWTEDGDGLVGTLELPLAVGTVGGALRVHRGAALAVRLAGALGVPAACTGRVAPVATDADPAAERAEAGSFLPAARLAAIAAAAGLACNLAALRALATEGIQRGHMTLHARAIARAAGVPDDLIATVAAELAAGGDVRIEAVRGIMERIRATATGTPPPGEREPQ